MAPGPGRAASTRVSRGRRLGRREGTLLGAAAAAGLVGVLVLVLIGRSHLGADGVLVTAVLGVALMQALTLAGLLYVVRAVRRDARNTKLFHQRMAVSTDRIQRQGKAARERAATQETRIEKSGQRNQKQVVELGKHVVELGEKLNRQSDEARMEARRLQLVGQRQVQALMNMRDLVRLDAAVPPAGGWAASPDLLLFCVDSMLADKPELVVECGSGLSTLFLALAAEQHELPTRIVSLENSEEYAAKTRALLERHGVGHRAEVRLAPLERTSLPDHETAWYAESAVGDLDRIGMLIVDGPPASTGPKARYPAVPLLRNRFAERCTIVVDDLIRASDEETAEAWSALLPDFDYSVSIEFEKHIGLLARR